MDDECVEKLGRPISSLKVTELKEELTKRALTKSGTKIELVNRLRVAIQKESIQYSEDQVDLQESCHEKEQESTEGVEDIHTGSIANNESYQKKDEVDVNVQHQETLVQVHSTDLKNDTKTEEDNLNNQDSLNKCESENFLDEEVGKDDDSNDEDDNKHTSDKTSVNEGPSKLTNDPQSKVNNDIIGSGEASQSKKEGKRRRWTTKTSPKDNEIIQKGITSFGLSSQQLLKLIPGDVLENKTTEMTKNDSKEGSESKNNEGKDQSFSDVIDEVAAGKETDEHKDHNPEDTRSPSEDREPSEFLYIRNLVRPFTIGQLKEVLTRHGNMIEDKFWTDRVKSRCLVVYESIDAAKATKEELHNQHWPQSNPKTLKIVYSNESTLEELRNEEEIKTKASVKPQQENNSSKKNNRNINERLGGKKDGDSVLSTKNRDSEKPDLDEARNPQNLDDLFRKTKTKPSICWLPLNETQAEQKSKERKELEEKRVQRLQERKKRSPSSRKKLKKRSPSPSRTAKLHKRTRSRSISKLRARSPSLSRSRSRTRSPTRSPSSSRSPINRRNAYQDRRRAPLPQPPRRHFSPRERYSPLLPRSTYSPPRRRMSPPNRNRQISPLLKRQKSPMIRRSPARLVRRQRFSPRPSSPFLRRRSPSPRRRSPSPRRRSPSPRRRSPSPRRRSPSPPRRRLISPRRRSPSPRRRVHSPLLPKRRRSDSEESFERVVSKRHDPGMRYYPPHM